MVDILSEKDSKFVSDSQFPGIETGSEFHDSGDIKAC
jgi:hypothetical protein